MNVFPREQNTKGGQWGPEIAAAADTVSLIVSKNPPSVNRPRAVLHRAGASQFNVIFHYNGQCRQKTKPPQSTGDLKFKLPDPGMMRLIQLRHTLARSDMMR